MPKKIMEVSELTNLMEAYRDIDSGYVKINDLTTDLKLKEKESELDAVESLFNLCAISGEYRFHAFLALQSFAQDSLLPENKVEDLLAMSLNDYSDRDEFFRCLSSLNHNPKYASALIKFADNLLEKEKKLGWRASQWNVYSNRWTAFYIIGEVLGASESYIEKIIPFLTEELLLKMFKEALKENDKNMQLGHFELLNILSNLRYYHRKEGGD